MKKTRFFLLLILLFSQISSSLYCESTTPKPYEKDEFPEALKDLRRFEILTLGSMPFVMLDVNLVYAGIRVANGKSQTYSPFNTASYTQDEQVKLILTSLGISSCIGISDFIIRKIKRSSTRNKQSENQKNIFITPIDEDPEAIKIESKNKINSEDSDEVEFLE